MSEPARLMTPSTGPIAYEVDDTVPLTIRVIPSEPTPETSPDGVPTVTLYVSGTTGLLTLGAHWWPSDSELTGIRQNLAAALGRSPAEFIVTSDAVRISGVSLVLSDDTSGASIELARTASSGFPPFTALFSVDVSAHVEAVRRACEGELGLLWVQVEADLARGRSATTVLAAQVGSWAEDLVALDDGELPGRVDALVEQGLVHRTRSATPDAAPHDLAAQADAMAAERFAGALRSAPVPVGGKATVGVAATAHRPERIPLVRRADVATWLRASPAGHVFATDAGVKPDPGTQAPAGLSHRRVRVGFATDGAPIAAVELSGGGETVTLAPPLPPEVSVAVAAELDVTTRYLEGGDAYRVTLPAADEWALSPADLGLTPVSVDASRLRDAGATAVQADVFYQPEDRGTPDRRTVRFEGNTWRADWLVVSRGPDLAGQLVIGLTVTPRGTAEVPARVQSDTAAVRL
jgi:hypothetical protein